MMLVSSLIYSARLFKLSEYAIAFILMSFGTSIPELFVGLSSALNDIPNLSLGNIFGANLINISLIIGIAALINQGKGLSIDSKISRENFWLAAFLAFLPILLISDGVISRGDGLALLASFIIYIWKILGEKEYFTKVLNKITVREGFAAAAMRQLFNFFLAVVFLILSSALLVWSGKNIAGELTLDILAFGTIFMAIGTTLPEMAFGVRAALLNHGSMSIGNSLGSVAFNSTFILGAVSLINPIRLNAETNLALVSIFLFLAFILFNIFVYTKNIISKKEALILIALYLIFVFSESWRLL